MQNTTAERRTTVTVLLYDKILQTNSITTLLPKCQINYLWGIGFSIALYYVIWNMGFNLAILHQRWIFTYYIVYFFSKFAKCKSQNLSSWNKVAAEKTQRLDLQCIFNGCSSAYMEDILAYICSSKFHLLTPLRFNAYFSIFHFQF